MVAVCRAAMDASQPVNLAHTGPVPPRYPSQVGSPYTATSCVKHAGLFYVEGIVCLGCAAFRAS